jgi:hypothetical protein
MAQQNEDPNCAFAKGHKLSEYNVTNQRLQMLHKVTVYSVLVTSMPTVGFEPIKSAGERPQTYALDRAATGTSK